MRLGRRAKRVAAILVGLAGALLAAEITLQLVVRLDLLPPGNDFVDFIHQLDSMPIEGSIYRRSADETLALELIPGSHRGHIRVNSYGFRGPEYALSPPPGGLRVAFVGDSETFGAALPESQTITGMVQRVLRARLPGRTVQVLDFGFPGYDSVQEARELETRVLRFSPDVVVLYYVLNDPLPPELTTLMKRKFYYRSDLVMLLRWFYQRFIPTAYYYRSTHDRRAIIELYRRLHDPRHFAPAAAAIRRMARLTARSGARFILVIAPEVVAYDDFAHYPYRSIHERLYRFAAEGIDVVDPLDVLARSGHRPRDFWVSVTDPHKNALANSILAPPIAAAILHAAS